MSGKQINYNIQGLRGILAIMVFGGHALHTFSLCTVESLDSTPLHLLWDGQAAVIFFFFLSGYFYYTLRPLTIHKYASIIIKRILRLTPPYLLTIIVGALLCNYFLGHKMPNGCNVSNWFAGFWTEPVTWKRLLYESEVIFVRKGESYTYINPMSWYLTVDYRMMLIVPVIVHFINKTKINYFLIVAMVCIICSLTKVGIFPVVFLLGASLHYYKETILSIVRKHKYIPVIIAILGITLLNCNNFFKVLSVEDHTGLIQAIGVYLLLSVILNLPEVSVLSSKPLVKIGNVSYEFYIIHFVSLELLQHYINNKLVFIVLCFILTLILATAVHNINNRMVKFVTSKVRILN
jgi:peptidoglycan/LPS O-acetylase OafA/YrhL